MKIQFQMRLVVVRSIVNKREFTIHNPLNQKSQIAYTYTYHHFKVCVARDTPACYCYGASTFDECSSIQGHNC